MAQGMQIGREPQSALCPHSQHQLGLETLQGAHMEAQQPGGWKEPSAAGNIWKHSWENAMVEGLCCWTARGVGDPRQGEDTTEGARLRWGHPRDRGDQAEGTTGRGKGQWGGQWEAAETELLLEAALGSASHPERGEAEGQPRCWEWPHGGAGHHLSLGSWEETLRWGIPSFSQHEVSFEKLGEFVNKLCKKFRDSVVSYTQLS